jgi:hypothetical protein
MSKKIPECDLRVAPDHIDTPVNFILDEGGNQFKHMKEIPQESLHSSLLF